MVCGVVSGRLRWLDTDAACHRKGSRGISRRALVYVGETWKHQGLTREEPVDGAFLSRHQIMCGSVTNYSRWPWRCKQRGLEPN